MVQTRTGKGTLQMQWERLQTQREKKIDIVVDEMVQRLNREGVNGYDTQPTNPVPLPRHYVWKKQDGTVVERYATDTQAVAWGWTRVWPEMLTSAGQLIDNENDRRFRRLQLQGLR